VALYNFRNIEVKSDGVMPLHTGKMRSALVAVLDSTDVGISLYQQAEGYQFLGITIYRFTIHTRTIPNGVF
jgi:hypothetical protein